MNQPLRLLLTAAAATLGFSAPAQITITQSDFPALPTTTELYQGARLSSAASPQRGTNQTWDFSSLVASSFTSQATYTTPPVNPAFSTATRARAYTTSVGGLLVQGIRYEALTPNGLQYLGFHLPQQSFSLTSVTGGANDVLVVPAQDNVNPLTYDVALPLTMGTTNVSQYRAVTNALMTVVGFGLNQAPVSLVQRVERADTVVGWGTLRVPTPSGASAPQQVLMLRHAVEEQDSVYLFSMPAPALLLTAFGLQQGQIITSHSIDFARSGSSQPMASFFYSDSSLTTLTGVSYSREFNLTASPADLTGQLGGVVAYPNPAADGRFVVAAGNGSRQPVQLTVRDLTGRQLAAVTAVTGELTEVLAGLAAGAYVVEVTMADGTRGTIRVTR